MPAPTDAPLRVGTRGSALALTQTELVVAALRAVRPGLDVELVRITTTGDTVTDRPYAAIGPKGVFAAELQHALLVGAVDVAVHSLKDLPADEPPGLTVAAVPRRADPADVLVSRDGATLDELPSGARVGTSSSRRVAMVRARRPDLVPVPIRGNVDTRLAKVARGEVDAALLAAAGLERLGRLDEATQRLDPLVFTPAPGQGALAVEAKSDRVAGDLAWLAGADDHPTRSAVTAERAFLRAMEGGCDVPLGAFAVIADDGSLTLHGVVAAPDGSEEIRGDAQGREPDRVGRDLAAQLAARGAARLVAAARGAAP